MRRRFAAVLVVLAITLAAASSSASPHRPSHSPKPKPTATVATTTTPTIVPTAPASVGIYGMAIAADTLANTALNEGPITLRFVPERSGTLVSIRVYYVVGTHITESDPDSGYAAGNGGTRSVVLTTDDGTVLDQTIQSGLERFITHSLSASLIAGQPYKVIITNLSGPDDWISINALYVWDPDPAGVQPRYPDWTLARNGVIRPRFLPILELDWSDGVSGIGYMECWQRGSPDAQPRISGAYRVSETFNLPIASTFNKVAVRVKRDSASTVSPLSVAIDGVVLGSIPATTFTVGSQEDGPSNHNSWGSLLVPISLAAGSHRLELSSTSTIYRAELIREGSSYGFAAGSYFTGGHAEIDTGSGWSIAQAPYGGNEGQGDFMFYLN